ncbi:MAG: hypothetical protein ACLRYD_10780 [Ruminococcus callidus]
MAFEIEALTAEQREQFAAKQIPDPLSPVLGILKPREWIIDAGKDVFLFAIGVHRDYPNEELFFFSLERSRDDFAAEKGKPAAEYANLEFPNLMGKSLEIRTGEYQITNTGRFEAGVRGLQSRRNI